MKLEGIGRYISCGYWTVSVICAYEHLVWENLRVMLYLFSLKSLMKSTVYELGWSDSSSISRIISKKL